MAGSLLVAVPIVCGCILFLLYDDRLLSSYGLIFTCTTVGQASDSMTALT